MEWNGQIVAISVHQDWIELGNFLRLMWVCIVTLGQMRNFHFKGDKQLGECRKKDKKASPSKIIF